MFQESRPTNVDRITALLEQSKKIRNTHPDCDEYSLFFYICSFLTLRLLNFADLRCVRPTIIEEVPMFKSDSPYKIQTQENRQ